MVWDVEREIFTLGGGFALRWYSLLFALGFVVGYFIVQEMFTKEGKPLRLLDSLLLYSVVGTVVGARLGHCLFYEPGEYLTDPLRILKVWEGGLASHGGFAGVMIALLLFCRKHREVSFFWLADRMTIPALLTGGFIRIGNFFNSEIVGRPTDVPWAVVFKKHDLLPRHPTQLYEAAGYLIITAILYGIYRAAGRKPMQGRLFGLVMVLGYGFRLVIETFKENQEAFESALPLNMGQLLSLPFILIGCFLVFGWQFRYPFFRWALTTEEDGSDESVTGGLASATVGNAVPRRGELRKQRKKARK